MAIFLRKRYLLLHRLVTQGVSWTWQMIPLSRANRQRIKNYLFQNLPVLFHRFKSYRDWQEDCTPFDSPLTRNMHYLYIGHDDSARVSLGDPARRLVVVSQDACAHGAQFLALGIIRTLTRDMNLRVEAVLLGGGRLTKEFSALTPVHVLNEFEAGVSDMNKLAHLLAQRGFTKAIVNTTASGRIIPPFRDAGIESICLVHELPGIIQSLKLQEQAKQIASTAKMVVFPAQSVATGFARFAQVDFAKQVIRPQGLYRKNKWRTDQEPARAKLREQLDARSDAKIVLAVGFADYRKGADLFVECATMILMMRKDVHFVWVGHCDPKMQNVIEGKLQSSLHRERIHFVGYLPDTALYHAGSDVYALTSREDPFPNVVLESFDVGVPVVAFSSTGGAANLVTEVGGLVAPLGDISAYSAAICKLLDSTELRKTLGKAGQEHIDKHFAFRTYLVDLCDMLGIDLQGSKQD